MTLVERNPNFISCPVSNLVLGGTRSIADITLSRDGLRKHGVRVIQGEVSGVDSDKRTVKLANGDSLSYDRLLLAPGIDFSTTPCGADPRDCRNADIPRVEGRTANRRPAQAT